jgi:UDP-glucuronate 4-epimerase
VAATRAAGELDVAPGSVLNIGGGDSVSLNRALEVLAGVAGRPLDVRRAAREVGDVVNTGADTTRAREVLGFTPRTDLEAGLEAEFEWVRERSAASAQVLSAS